MSSFRSLDNDVTAFITPVFDLADEPCALLRVVGNKALEFSTPLGIVRRTELTGEILLYVPNGSRMLTIKHPEWGVIRDYQFPKKLIGQHTYELRIREPKRESVVLHDTITRTIVDTVTVMPSHPRVPLRISGLLTVGVMQRDAVAGAMFCVMRRHGVYIHPQWNMHGSKKTESECDKEGHLADGNMPYYTGSVHRSSYLLTAGAIHRLTPHLAIYEGVGWGRSATSWQMIGSDGSTVWIGNKGKTYQGIALELGTMFTLGRWKLGVGATTISARTWCVNVGVGIDI